MSKIFLIAESGRPKDVLEAWRAEYYEGAKALRAFMIEIGADRSYGLPFERPAGFGFPRNAAPEGWTKPSRSGYSRPKRANTEMSGRLAALPYPDRPEQLIARELGLPLSINYDTPAQKGWRTLSATGMYAFDLCWTARADGSPGEVVLIAPDYETLARTAGVTEWLPENTGPVIPEGFRKVTEAELDLIFAEAKVRRETYVATNKEMALMLDAPSGPSDLYQAMQVAMCQFGRNLVIEFDSGYAGMGCAVRYESETIGVHPALEAAAFRIAPYLVKCEVEGWEDTMLASGRILMRHGEEPYLDMDDQESDWVFERDIDTGRLVDMEFEPEGPAPLLVPE